ncbi:hypothetical protein WQ57_13930 [Mesobacillus campisalis]|uniref:Crystaline entomocidal protoxin n=1 Tax=Mesobacillus campisalis TaxID=1408103 RepID=A0A0M2SX36_9BACI|nr:hypothetical protein [Mesobacillus campisalis]KKK37532.1 hypothetical protein WQ57_13930 [Mesobacillus campisalis]
MPEEPTQPSNGHTIDIDWETAINTGLTAAAEAFGASFGGPIGAALGNAIAGSLFNGGQEDKFAEAIRGLKESINKAIDNAFLKEHTGNVLGLGENLKTYVMTKDSRILHPILNDITQQIHNLFRFDSEEALVSLVYASNIHLFTLRALAGHAENPGQERGYYLNAKEKSLEYSIAISERTTQLSETINNSLSSNCVLLPVKREDSMWVETREFGREVGVSGAIFSFSYMYGDRFSPPATFPEIKRVPYPTDLAGRIMNNFPGDIYSNSDAKAKCEDYSNDIKEKRRTSLNNLLTPIQHSTQVWRNISQGLESRVML